MSNWDKRWMDLATLVSSWSKDRSRKCGAVIVDHRESVVSLGWNGFPRGINDNVDERHERPAKYQWTEHAERNAIYGAASRGHSVQGCTMYVSWYPCADCARAIIQSGIGFLVCVEPDWNDPRWASDFAVVKTMFDEAVVEVDFVHGFEAPRTRMGKKERARIVLLEKQVQLLTRVVNAQPELSSVYVQEAHKFYDDPEAIAAREVLKEQS